MRLWSLVSTSLLAGVHSQIPEACEWVLWPLPEEYSCGGSAAELSQSFAFSAVGEDSDVLQRAFQRYSDIVDRVVQTPRGSTDVFGKSRPTASFTLDGLDVVVEDDELDLQLSTSEAYTLTVREGGRGVLKADTVYGAIRGLERFSQLVTDGGMVEYVPWSIQDKPRFAHRGVLLDTSRNFYPLQSVLHLIDGIAFNMMNVFHWHIVDQQSFPAQSDAVPDLAHYGAYSHLETYSVEDMRYAVDYARDRGVRIVAEFDTPGHAHSWGMMNSNLTICSNEQPWWLYCAEPPCGQLDPSKEEVWTVLEDLFQEMTQVFPDRFFHAGADEVNFACWAKGEDLRRWMEEQGYSDYNQVLEYFLDREYGLLMDMGKTPVSWEEPFADGVPTHPSTVFQVWRSHQVLHDILRAGHRAILSNSDAWYLDCGGGGWIQPGNSWCDPYKTWWTMYDNEPTKDWPGDLPGSAEELILGGEACSWSENSDSTNMDERIWPRASAVAERLWSRKEVTSHEHALYRLSTHRERLVTRGVSAIPLQPKWCRLHPGECAFIQKGAVGREEL